MFAIFICIAISYVSDEQIPLLENIAVKLVESMCAIYTKAGFGLKDEEASYFVGFQTSIINDRLALKPFFLNLLENNTFCFVRPRFQHFNCAIDNKRELGIIVCQIVQTCDYFND